MLGKTILNYTILRQLDAGGMGSVFLAKHILLDHQVVVKILLEKNNSNPNIVHRFVQEAKILTQLTHPNIVRLINFDKDATFGYVILMDYVAGKTLWDYQAAYPACQLPFQQAIALFTELLDAFAYAHE
jgi:eukaryotic-like serine/threonine-protein kinase